MRFPPPSPWKQLATSVDPDREYVAFVSRFYLKSRWQVPGFMIHGQRVMKQLDAAPGIVGWALAADIISLEFDTASVWEGAEALRAFNHSGQHAVALERFDGAMKRRGTFVYYTIRGADIPISWTEARSRLDERIAGMG